MAAGDSSGSFATLLQRHRSAAGLSQQELAERAGLSQRGLSDLERGARRTPHPATVRRLAEALRLNGPEHVAFVAAARAAAPSPAAVRGPELSPRPLAAAPRTNLPSPTGALVGRERELATARDQVLRQDVRLLTFTGAGGSGKTRLAVDVAADLVDRFEDGVFFVDLAAISNAELVPATIAQALEIWDFGGRPVLDSLKDYVRRRSLLLVLDNFEQVLKAAPVVTELLGAGPELKVLVTSRAPLELRGEHELAVPPLDVPDPVRLASLESLSMYGAVALFVERASAIRPDFALTDANAQAVAEICVRLDGLPLAIELAAARIRLLSVSALLARLDHRLPLLTGGARDAPARQQTLRATIGWSYELLEEPERALFRRLAIFIGGCTLQAVGAICGPGGEGPVQVLDGVASLLAKSLVRLEESPEGEPRVHQLATIREFAWEQLEHSGELLELRERHLEHFLALAEAAEPELIAPRQAEWFDRLERDYDNLRAALEWSCTAPRVEAGVRMASALSFFWAVRGHGRENLLRILALASLAPPGTAIRARALTVAAHVRGLMVGDQAGAAEVADEAVRIWRALGDRHGLAEGLVRRANSALALGDAQLAMELLLEARSLLPGLDRHTQATAYVSLLLGEVAHALGQHDQALALQEAAVREAQERGDAHAVAYGLRELARLRRGEGESQRSAAVLRQSLSLLQPLRDIRCAQLCLEDLAGLLFESAPPTEVARLFGASDALLAAMGKSLDAARRQSRERAVATLESRCDPDALAGAWAEGRAMGLEEAIGEALAVVRPS